MTVSQCTALLLLFVPILYISWRHYFQLADQCVQDWARTKNYEILYLEKCFVRLGPYFGRAFRGQQVFEIRVRDLSNGLVREGWIRVNVPWYGGFFNLFSDSPVHETWRP